MSRQQPPSSSSSSSTSSATPQTSTRLHSQRKQQKQQPTQQNPFTDPEEHWKENNPYRTHRSSSARNPRPHPSSRHNSDHHHHHPHHHQHRRRISRIPGPDPVDCLGAVTGTPYHHDGPYEATLLARQIPGRAPVDALKTSNAAALKATPQASIADCMHLHYPLQGTAMYPPGVGGVGEYEEYDVMVKDGRYRRWDHMVYHDDDRKGKGEPAFSLDEAEKARKQQQRDGGQELDRKGSTGGRLEGWRRRLSSLRKKE